MRSREHHRQTIREQVPRRRRRRPREGFHFVRVEGRRSHVQDRGGEEEVRLRRRRSRSSE